ncbi:MAG: hypothetical protein ACTSSN_13415 [Candidatus Heimdallarchaeaceae archaeon]
MVQNESISARTAVTVQSVRTVTVPKWLELEASERSIKKAAELVNAYHKVTNLRVYKNVIRVDVKGSQGNRYIVKASIFDRKKEERPELLECNCIHGTQGTKGLCYHKIALILKVLSLPIMPIDNTPQNYEDDFVLED